MKSQGITQAGDGTNPDLGSLFLAGIKKLSQFPPHLLNLDLPSVLQKFDARHSKLQRGFAAEQPKRYKLLKISKRAKKLNECQNIKAIKFTYHFPDLKLLESISAAEHLRSRPRFHSVSQSAKTISAHRCKVRIPYTSPDSAWIFCVLDHQRRGIGDCSTEASKCSRATAPSPDIQTSKETNGRTEEPPNIFTL
ncbi:hypothetical protein AXF42_Ash014594 [Apostasia shenzhenica]|uniref:Uncharacterized protein n=1 Tax=Apostasia shenzhenica TaxID=1088818 RepID=A0A2I0AK37_9ASPA|nr:hypothetical protein AXF42_Ash014594 [Apostasia shenzhenica]